MRIDDYCKSDVDTDGLLQPIELTSIAHQRTGTRTRPRVAIPFPGTYEIVPQQAVPTYQYDLDDPDWEKNGYENESVDNGNVGKWHVRCNVSIYG